MPFVNNFEDFYNQTKAHCKRVKSLGLRVYELTESKLDKKLVEAFLDLHDQGKFEDDAESLHRLYNYYGHDFFDEESKAEKDQAISDLSYKEQAIAGEFFKNNNVSDEDALELLSIEKIADFVDRGLSPVASEEFGREMKPASQMLTKAKEREIALALELEYKERFNKTAA